MSDFIDPVDDYVGNSETYVDASFYANIPLERQEEEIKGKTIVQASYPIMDKVDEWFSEQITACDSRRSILAWAVGHGQDPDLTARAFDIVRELLEAKQQDFNDYRRDNG